MTKIIFILLLSLNSLYAADLMVLTLNTYGLPDIGQKKSTYQRMQAICHKLSNSSYDIVLLQEVWMKRQRKVFKNCGYPFVIDHREKSLSSGLLILSRHQILQSKRYILPKPKGFRAIFKHGEAIARKSLYLAQVDVDGAKVWVANTHLVSNYCENEERQACVTYELMRKRQIEFITHIFDRETQGDPVIFGGDLNFGPKKIARDQVWDEMHFLFPGFSQAPVMADVSTFSSQNLFNTGKADPGKIDHLYGSDFFTVGDGKLAFTETFVDSKGVHRQFSDHYGWESNFQF